MSLPIQNLNQPFFVGSGKGSFRKDGVSGDVGWLAGNSYIIEIIGTDDGTSLPVGGRDTIEFTGIYAEGYGNPTLNAVTNPFPSNFVPPEYTFVARNGGYPRIGNTSTTTNVTFGYPEVTDGNYARNDRSNWATDDRGVFIPSARGRFIFDFNAAPGGNGNDNLNFVRGNNTTATFLGTDFLVYTNENAALAFDGEQFSHLHFGGTGGSADNSTIRLYNCVVKFAQASTQVNSRLKFFCNNMSVDGLKIDFGSANLYEPNTFSFEFQAGAAPDQFDNVEFIDASTVNFGSGSRQLVITAAGSSFNYVVNGLGARNAILWQANAASQLTLRNPLFRTPKAADSASDPNVGRGIIKAERTLTGKYTIAGENAPDVDLTVVQRQSDANQSVYKFSTSGVTTAQSTQAVSADAAITLTNPIDANGAFSYNLQEYTQPAISSLSSNGGITVELTNKYNIIATQHGYVSSRQDDYYLGGQVDSAAKFDSEFGVSDSTSRATFSPLGVAMGTINLPADPVVQPQITTFPASRYVEGFRCTSWDDVWCALHTFGNVRADSAGANRGVYAGVAESRTTVNFGSTGIILRDSATLPAGGVSAGNVSLDGNNYNILIDAANWTDIAGGIDTIKTTGGIDLAGARQTGITFDGSAGANVIVSEPDMFSALQTDTATNYSFRECDFTNIQLSSTLTANSFIVFNDSTATGSGNSIVAAGAFDLVLQDSPITTTSNANVSFVQFLNYTLTFNEAALLADLTKVRWAESSDGDIDVPGTFSNTGFLTAISGNDLTITFTVDVKSGVPNKIWAGIFYDGYYEEQITASSASANITLDSLTTAELDFSIANSSLVLTSGTDLLDITVPAIASATADIVATLNDTTGGNLAQGWTNAVARMGMRRGIQESDNYAEALALGYVDAKWFTWTETATVIAESGRLNYKHAASNIIFEPAGRIILPNGTDQWRSVSSTAVNERIVFDPDAAGAKGPEIVSLLEDSLDDFQTELQGSNTNATLTSIQRKVGGLY